MTSSIQTISEAILFNEDEEITIIQHWMIDEILEITSNNPEYYKQNRRYYKL